MKTLFSCIKFVLLALALCVQSCSDDKVEGAEFSLSRDGQEVTAFTFGYSEMHQLVTLSSNTGWSLNSNQPWCTLSNVSGNATEGQTIRVTVLRNTTGQTRTAQLTFDAGGNVRQYTVTQTAEGADTYPAGMEEDALTVARNIYAGINLGNTLESTGGETAWGAPLTSQAIIDYMKEMGFNAVRIPCSWNQYLEADGITIQPSWMARVTEVVDYCMNAGMYAILNIHWDGGWVDDHINAAVETEDNIAALESKLYAIWSQIATNFRDYDGKLLFAGLNEPPVNNRDDMAILKRYEQAFVDAVRATGGNNLWRNLVVQGPTTDIDKTLRWMEFPEDPTPGRLLLEVHFYPWNFALDEDPATCNYFWGERYLDDPKYAPMDAAYQEGYVDSQFALMKENFVDRGIPVILGEYGLVYRTHPDPDLQAECEESEGYYLGYVTKQAKNNGLAPFLWDVSGHRLYDRTTLQIILPTIHDQIMEGAAAGQYPF
ncbi:cellulase family glycosylhydrolase [Bacteroides sp. ET71]|uniref:cellulase family glycosylhydrolase n=1 Tax=Bacteroides sp. ET71 TaxID=2939421 RepID=UPI0020122C18|nr:cellulase family glycosylhydrolase [Bacteroides sp. ET71]MCL1615600.1 cellulase family glycosylhydrolase [Bacteroides sp. ET71]